jgi:large subunit ribosomal protein L10
MRAEKQLLLDELQSKLASGKAIILARYQQLGANAAAEFRTVVRKAGGDFEVMSKRMLLKAAEQQGLSLGDIDLAGHIGVVIVSDDTVQATKAVIDFGRDREDAVRVVGGYIDGVVYGAEAVEKLASLPALPEMRAQFLGLLEAPMAQTLAVVEALLTSLLHCLENKRKADLEKT